MSANARILTLKEALSSGVHYAQTKPDVCGMWAGEYDGDSVVVFEDENFQQCGGKINRTVVEIPNVPCYSGLTFGIAARYDLHFRGFVSAYGLSWRCWSNNPTMAQMYDTPWRRITKTEIDEALEFAQQREADMIRAVTEMLQGGG